nr:ABA insensitive 3 [Paeonia rockii]
MKKASGVDLHASGFEENIMDGGGGGGGDESNPSNFDGMEGLLDVSEASMFYGDDFPPLPDFPCMSSSSSSSTAPAPVKVMTCSSSSSSSASSSSVASWAVLKSDAEDDLVERSQHYYHHYHQDQRDVSASALSSTDSMEIQRPGDEMTCMDVMENFGCLDLLENNDIWDPSSIFNQHQTPLEFDPPPEGLLHFSAQQQQQAQQFVSQNEVQQQGSNPSDDLAMVFFEWLKSNKESISAEDLRSIKLKRATIECAAKRLGGGKEGMKQLLKLILEWVQNNKLQKKQRLKEAAASASASASASGVATSQFPYQYQDSFQNPNPNPNPNPSVLPHPDLNQCFPPSTSWIPHQQPYVTDPAAATVMPTYPRMVGGYMSTDPFSSGTSATPLNQNINVHPNNYPHPSSTSYHHHLQPQPQQQHMIDSTRSWPQAHFSVPPSNYYSYPDHNNFPPAPVQVQPMVSYGNQHYPSQYFPGQGSDGLMRLGSSATKEARKKRMARQRRSFSHHPRHHHNHQQNQATEQHSRLGRDKCTSGGGVHANKPPVGNWVYWPSASASTSVVVPPAEPQATKSHKADRQAPQTQNSQRQTASGKRQGLKSEKNLRFLLQKVLKQSDVGSLGRIVLPKKEAETHLPELDARDGISIAMEDIGTSRVWNMRYRFWPNNKSRMYLLENTGDFVRSNGLQEGDSIVLYSDIKCGKYMIRGVKVRPTGPKSEGKRPGKAPKGQCTSPDRSDSPK